MCVLEDVDTSLSLSFSVKPKKSSPMSIEQWLESNLSPLSLRLNFLPLSHWDNAMWSENGITWLTLYPSCWVASCSFISLELLPVTAKFGGLPCRFLSPKLTKKAAALHFYSRKEHQLSREDLWILISQLLMGQTLCILQVRKQSQTNLTWQEYQSPRFWKRH